MKIKSKPYIKTKYIKMANKNKKVEVVINEKTYSFKFLPVYDDKENPEQIFCTSCPLCDFCDLISDPKNPDNKERSFQDFCIETGDQTPEDMFSEGKFENLVPEISDVLKFANDFNQNIYKQMLQKDRYVRLGDVIDSFCGPDGYTCPVYNKDHTNCSSENGLCVLRKLFSNT